MLRKPQVAVILGALTLASLAASPAAQAATYSSTGARCTIVGTSQADHLRGTSSRDVICGLGGNDVIDARGGNDVVDGGAGADTITGGDGSDVLRGGLGRDVLAGAAGTDTVAGGADGDTITGGSGGDDLEGDGGNDDLSGDGGSDDINGDAGTNWCTVGSTDTQSGCVYDSQDPVVDQAQLSTDHVDVTNRNQQVTVRMHVTDDTGVSEVTALAYDDVNNSGTLIGYGSLVQGTVRDGWWEATIVVPHWGPAGSFPFRVSLRDRVGRRVEQPFPDRVLTVSDANPDDDLPSATLRTPQPGTSYDVRTSGQDVVVKARVTDAVSGVWYTDMCLWKPQDGYYTNLPCVGADLVSGDTHDGIWRAVVRIPKGDTGGDWNAALDTLDWAHKSSSPVQWVGPDVYRYWTNDGQNTDEYVQAFPDGVGRFSVLGTDDSVPPTLESLSLTPNPVDTLNSSATVQISVHAVDAPGGGVTAAGVAFTSTTNPDSDLLPRVELQLTKGTDTDGTWTGTLTIPQGSPPDTYALQAWVQDTSHFRSYVSSGSPYAGDSDQSPLPGDAQLVVGSGTGG